MSVPQTTAKSHKIAAKPKLGLILSSTTLATSAPAYRAPAAAHMPSICRASQPTATAPRMSAAMTPRMELCSADSAASATMRPPTATRSASRARPISRCHSHRRTIDASHQKTAKTKPPIHAVASARLPIATAAATRGLRSEPNQARGTERIATGSSPLTAMRTSSRRRLDGRGLDDGAKPPFARGVLVERGEEGRVVEIRPQDREEHEFGVGRLPEQEIRQPHFAGGANDEIGVGKASRVEPLGQFVRPDRPSVEAPVANVDRQTPRRLEDFLPPAVIESHREREPVIAGGQGFGLDDEPDDVTREIVPFADDPDPDAIGVEFSEIVANEPLEEAHQHRHLLRRTAPVLRREAIDRKELHAALDRRTDNPAHGLDAAPMALEARQAARLSPTAVAVHDDGDVGRRPSRTGSGAMMMHEGLGQRRRSSRPALSPFP